MSKRALNAGIVIVLAALLAVTLAGLLAGQSKSETVRVGNADIGGVVTGAKGPEAGVWVIAETTDLPTRFDQERRHRRSGPLPGAGSAEGELRRVGPRLRARRFAEGQSGAGQDR